MRFLSVVPNRRLLYWFCLVPTIEAAAAVLDASTVKNSLIWRNTLVCNIHFRTMLVTVCWNTDLHPARHRATSVNHWSRRSNQQCWHPDCYQNEPTTVWSQRLLPALFKQQSNLHEPQQYRTGTQKSNSSIKLLCIMQCQYSMIAYRLSHYWR